MNGRHQFLRREWRRILTGEGGNVIILVALGAFLMVAAVGTAIDMSRAQTLETRMHAALDAAGLAALNTASTINVQTQAQKYFDANFPKNYLGTTGDIKITTSLSADGSTLDLKASGTQKASFMQVVGIDTVDVATQSQVKRGQGPQNQGPQGCHPTLQELLNDCYALQNAHPFNDGFGVFPNWWPTSDAAMQTLYSYSQQHYGYTGTLQDYERHGSAFVSADYNGPVYAVPIGNAPPGNPPSILNGGPSFKDVNYTDFTYYDGWPNTPGAHPWVSIPPHTPNFNNGPINLPFTAILGRSPDGYIMLEEQVNVAPTTSANFTTDDTHDFHYCALQIGTPDCWKTH